VTKANWVIGETERHMIEVSASVWSGKVMIRVDGRDITSTYQIGVSNKSYKFTVGEKERHDVEIRVGGLVNANFTLFVDGKLIGTA